VTGRIDSPSAFYERLSALARGLIEEALRDLGPGEPVDHHVHVAGMGTGAGDDDAKPDTWLHPDYRSWRHPILRAEAKLFLQACGIDDPGNAGEQYVRRLASLVKASAAGGTYFLYAQDWRYEKPPANRSPNRDKTDLFVDSDYVIAIARRLNAEDNGGARFVPVASVHPYRCDAVEALAGLAEKGVKHIKWLPPAQNIDPADDLLRPFYRAMKQYEFTLLSHTGDEHTFRVRDSAQDFANPLRLAPALEEGVTVVMLHAARDGIERTPGPDGRCRPYAARFFEMMKRHPVNLFGEISMVPYLGTHSLLEDLVGDPEISGRLVNGSDYPVPGIAAIDPTDRLMRAGYLSGNNQFGFGQAGQKADALREIRRLNPLLFDFVLKRTLRISGRKLPKSVFQGLPSNRPQVCCS
jgi:mannonate dehydratase